MAIDKLLDELSDTQLGAEIRRWANQIHSRDVQVFDHHGFAGALSLIQIAHQINRGFKISVPDLTYKDEPVGTFTVSVTKHRPDKKSFTNSETPEKGIDI